MAESSKPRSIQGRAPHRRDEGARIAVLHAADDLLVERGFAGVTIEGIAARAGVAKQTIYRWWPSKVDILLDTLINDASHHLAISETATPADDLRKYLRALARFLGKEASGQVLLALIGQAQHDAEMATMFRQSYLDPQRKLERALLARVFEAGALPAGADLDITLDRLLGPILYRALTGRSVPRKFVDALVDSVLVTAAPAPALTA